MRGRFAAFWDKGLSGNCSNLTFRHHWGKADRLVVLWRRCLSPRATSTEGAGWVIS